MCGITRWNADRSSDAVFGGRGRHLRSYSAPLIDRLNSRCQRLFGECVEDSFRPPADVDSKELLGLEYLFSQSSGEAFSLADIGSDGPTETEEVIEPDQADPNQAYVSDTEESRDAALDVAPPHFTVTSRDTTSARPPACEDVCSQNPLLGFDKLQRFCAALVDVVKAEDKLSLTTEQRDNIIALWNRVEEHDKQPQRFTQPAQEGQPGGSFGGVEAEDGQALRASPAGHQRREQLADVHTGEAAVAAESQPVPRQPRERRHSEGLREDPARCLGGGQRAVQSGNPSPQNQHQYGAGLYSPPGEAPEPPRHQTAHHNCKDILHLHCLFAPAPLQPQVLPPPDYPVVVFDPTPSTAGTKVLKERRSMLQQSSRTATAPSTSSVLPGPAAPASSSSHSLPLSQPPTSFVTLPGPAKIPALTSTGASSAAPATQTSGTTVSWVRATNYRRKLLTQDSGEIDTKVSRVHNLPLCKLCGWPTQGHRKHKKKTFCPVTMMSTSKGMDSTKVYNNFEHFQRKVDTKL